MFICARKVYCNHDLLDKREPLLKKNMNYVCYGGSGFMFLRFPILLMMEIVLFT